MITSNVLSRTFHILYGKTTGTCFTIDHEGKQYLITAKHVVKGISNGDQLNFWHEDRWKSFQIKVIGVSEDPVDIAVLSLSFQISPKSTLEPKSEGLILGQDVYFLGFPYGRFGPHGEINRDFPFPFVKKAIVSCFYKEGEFNLYYLDGHNNPGFSGGPVVWNDPKDSPRDKINLKVAGIISGYESAFQKINIEGQDDPIVVQENTGIVLVWPIEEAIKLIKNNPVGVLLK